jgi:hypothetical protein
MDTVSLFDIAINMTVSQFIQHMRLILWVSVLWKSMSCALMSLTVPGICRKLFLSQLVYYHMYYVGQCVLICNIWRKYSGLLECRAVPWWQTTENLILHETVIQYILVDENTKNYFTVNYMLPSAFCTFCIACNPFYVHNIQGVFFAFVFRLLVVIIARDF